MFWFIRADEAHLKAQCIQCVEPVTVQFFVLGHTVFLLFIWKDGHGKFPENQKWAERLRTPESKFWLWMMWVWWPLHLCLCVFCSSGASYCGRGVSRWWALIQLLQSVICEGWMHVSILISLLASIGLDGCVVHFVVYITFTPPMLSLPTVITDFQVWQCNRNVN